MDTHALYAGSFDPITLGHIDIIKQALLTFDRVTIGIGINPKKQRLFEIDHSIVLIQEALAKTLSTEAFERVTVASYAGKVLSDFASEIGAFHIVRGLRQVSDFDDEFKLHGAIERLSSLMTMTYFLCATPNLHISSSMARELASYGKPVSWLVTPNVQHALEDKFREA